MTWIIALVVVALLLVPLAIMALQVDDWSRDLTTNTAATSPESDDPAMRPFETTATFIEIDRAARTIAQAHSDWVYVEADEPEIHLLHVTGLMRYRDDVTLTVRPLAEGRALIDIHSASRVGKGDLGQNPRNIRELRSYLSEQLQ